MLYKCPIIFVKSLKKNVWITLSKGLYIERGNINFKFFTKKGSIVVPKGLYYERVIILFSQTRKGEYYEKESYYN